MRRSRTLALVGTALLSCLALAGCITINTPLGGGSDNSLHETRISGHGDAKILWLNIDGFISASPSSHALGLVRQPSMLTRVSRVLDKAEGDAHIKAVVLRIDSPGGTVAASDEIYDRIKRFEVDTGTPVIASLGGVAASGGYYVAMGANRVIAEPTTITGSIGVIIVDVNAAGLMHKLGLADTSITSGPHKDIMSPLRKPKADERAIVQNVVDGLYHRFVSVVTSNRPALDRSQLAMITDGRIFPAPQAKRLGLVDAIGHQNDVLAAARQAAGVDQAEVIRYYQGRQAPDTLVAAAASAARRPAAVAGWLAQMGANSSFNGAEPLYLWRGSAR
ncbi:signal peptide peptidase SppA [Salinisphaera sp. SPP-AMP-43]|uniref:signal peptide peptidase SppA n=1 Tax=Salinisphaera sp. SPP-AMP-43 TaxID=3121288 RepID=UPI003C6DF9DA